ncbi:MAG: MFS transporter [Candidatus Cryptobacteroides sp.]
MSNQVSGKLTWTILSISLLTVMAGAAIAPALGIIKEHFCNASDLTLQLVVSLPALFIIIANLLFPFLCSHFDSKVLALSGLGLYVLSGVGCFLVDNIVVLLVLRAVLGLSVGVVMPLSTGLLAYYYPPEQQAKLMGLSAAMNQMGGVVATFLAGLLAQIGWNWSFLVYLLGLIAIVLVALFLPAEHLQGGKGPSLKLLRRFHPSVVGMFLVMILFFIYPTRFAICVHSGSDLSNNAITLIMVGLDLVAFLVGLVFGKLMNKFRKAMKYLPPICFIAGYFLLSMGTTVAGLLAGSAFIGIANGIGVPYMNTIASIKAGKEAASTVMPLLSSALYLGQFISPLLVSPLGNILFGSGDLFSPYKVGVLLGVIYLLQAFLTRNKQATGQ